MLEKARRIWKQMLLAEDAMLVYRVVRAPERRVFKIYVGNIDDKDVDAYVQKVANKFKRTQLIDQKSGQVDLRYNTLAVDQDYFVPVRDPNAPNPIDTLAGASNLDQIADIEYIQKKLLTALRVPKPFLGFDEATGDGKNLALLDIRFARTIQRLQRAVVAELEKIGIIHLYTLGFRGDDLLSFSLSLNNPSKIAELQELEHWSTKFDVAAKATENFFSRRWIAERLFNMTEEEFLRNQREIFYDRKFDAQIAGVAERMQESSAASPFGENPESPLGALGLS